ncbi:MAG: ketoacyl-ACP synthase III [Candidatus Eisenbacteria bacterium]|nr:ketoacyl-ACP synthase III [Candidatus Eisenbacteria bacterium]
MRAKIAGIAHYVPERVVTNHDLEVLMDTSDAWIVERTGIRERRYVREGQGTSDLGLEAARAALDQAGLTPADIDFIIFATLSPDYMFPGCGVLLQQKLGCPTIGALDVRTQCTGFVYGLSMADALIRSGTYRRILLVGAETQSMGLNFTTEGRDMAVIFADGAGAAVIVAGDDDGPGILASVLHSEGQYAKELWMEVPTCLAPSTRMTEMIAEGRHFPQMNGREVFKHATRRFVEAVDEVLEKIGAKREDIALLVPHQANKRISDAVAERLSIEPARLVVNVQRYGNTTAASIPIALSEAVAEGRAKPGDLVVLVAFGSGFTWGATAIRW